MFMKKIRVEYFKIFLFLCAILRRRKKIRERDRGNRYTNKWANYLFKPRSYDENEQRKFVCINTPHTPSLKRIYERDILDLLCGRKKISAKSEAKERWIWVGFFFNKSEKQLNISRGKPLAKMVANQFLLFPSNSFKK